MGLGSARRGLKAVLVALLVGYGALVCLGAGLRGRPVSARTMAHWSRLLCRILNVRIVRQGAPPPGTGLLVANHISWLDIFCIAAVCPSFFLAKQEVAQWPVFGWLTRRAGTAFIQRGADKGAREAAEQLTWRLRQGDRMVLFPEGTSTPGRSVKRFHARLFQAAIHARCPVQAVALRYPARDEPGGINALVPFVGDDDFVSHLWRLLGEPSIPVELYFAEPLTAEGQSRDTLARLTHRQITAVLESPAPGRSISAEATGLR
jgi:1-acyl-sn-glycerol-3-phosphate acyltransferase